MLKIMKLIRKYDIFQRTAALLLICGMTLSCTGCSFSDTVSGWLHKNERIDYHTAVSGTEAPPASLGDIREETNELLEAAQSAMADGRNRQAVHFASLAAARVSAMRYFVDWILWHNGEGCFLGAMTAYAEEDYGTMQSYLYEGFENDPTNADINAMLALIDRAAGNEDGVKLHIGLAEDGEMSAFSRTVLDALKGGA